MPRSDPQIFITIQIYPNRDYVYQIWSSCHQYLLSWLFVQHTIFEIKGHCDKVKGQIHYWHWYCTPLIRNLNPKFEAAMLNTLWDMTSFSEVKVTASGSKVKSTIKPNVAHLPLTGNLHTKSEAAVPNTFWDTGLTSLGLPSERSRSLSKGQRSNPLMTLMLHN